jgi:hypothetical protein
LPANTCPTGAAAGSCTTDIASLTPSTPVISRAGDTPEPPRCAAVPAGAPVLGTPGTTGATRIGVSWTAAARPNSTASGSTVLAGQKLARIISQAIAAFCRGELIAENLDILATHEVHQRGIGR